MNSVSIGTVAAGLGLTAIAGAGGGYAWQRAVGDDRPAHVASVASSIGAIALIAMLGRGTAKLPTAALLTSSAITIGSVGALAGALLGTTERRA